MLCTLGYQSLQEKDRKQTKAPPSTTEPWGTHAASPGSALTAQGIHAWVSHRRLGDTRHCFYIGAFQNVNHNTHVKSWYGHAKRLPWILLERAHTGTAGHCTKYVITRKPSQPATSAQNDRPASPPSCTSN